MLELNFATRPFQKVKFVRPLQNSRIDVQWVVLDLKLPGCLRIRVHRVESDLKLVWPCRNLIFIGRVRNPTIYEISNLTVI